MTNKHLLAVIGLGLLGTAALAEPLGTAFTYQGRLVEGGQPASGWYAMSFTLWDAGTNGHSLGQPQLEDRVAVSNGLFTVTLDFGVDPLGRSYFRGDARWLEIGVDHYKGTNYVTLVPRQPLTPTPYAIYAGAAGTAIPADNSVTSIKIVDGSVTSAKILDGTIINADLADNSVNAAKIVDGSVTSAKILDGTIINADLADNSVNATKIVDGSVTSAKIADNAVAAVDLASEVASLHKVSGGHLTVDADGNVGLGMSTPGFPLNFATAIGDKISLYGTGPNHYGLGIQSGLLQIHGSTDGADIAFGYGSSTNFTEQMRIQGNGHVGIGTASPDYPLDVRADQAVGRFLSTNGAEVSVLVLGNTAATARWLGAINFNSSSGNPGQISYATNTGLTFDAGGAERLRITPDGNVGLGMSTPGVPLNFAHEIGDKISLHGTGTNHYGFGIQSGLLQIHGSAASTDIAFGYGSSTNFTEQMRIKGSGNVGINKPNPSTTLDVNGTVTATAFAGPGAGLTGIIPADNSVTSAKIVDNTVATVDLADGAVNSAKVLNGSLLGADLANNTVTSLQLADSINLGDDAINGQLNVYHTSLGGPAISLSGSGGGGLQYLYSADGNVGITLNGNSGGAGLIGIQNTNGLSGVLLDGAGVGSGGQVSIYAQDGSSTVQLYGESDGAGLINVNNNLSQTRVAIDGEGNNAGGQINVYAADGGEGIVLYGDSGGGGLQYLYAADGDIGILLDGDNGGAGYISVRNTNGSPRVVMDGYSTGGGGEISVYDTTGTETIEILGAESGTEGGQIMMRNASGVNTVQLDSDASGVHCGFLALYTSNGVATVILDANGSGEGKITTQVLQITGGSDLSENFEINAEQDALQPGMIVSIDPQNAGELTLSQTAYDKKVAGIVSGAGGVRTGMLMGQKGTKADGQYPVALTGRVYCWVDATLNAIAPGDLITTSDIPGHGMKVADHTKAQGAILGKAMSPLKTGKGLVLVLVTLQ